MPVMFSEKAFEDAIEESLKWGGYVSRPNTAYDPALCLIPEDVMQFVIATQLEAWEKAGKVYKENARSGFLRELARVIEKRGTLDVLRDGFKYAGQPFKLAYFRPASTLNPEAQHRYQANVFAMMRQVMYKEGRKLALDLGLFLNGLPLFTVELKNPLTGQSVRDAMYQYQKDRDPREPLFAFGRCLAHFAVDVDEVYMTTHLRGDDTVFLPFNVGWGGGAGNPQVLAGYKTTYLWEKILAPDSLLNLVQDFVYKFTDVGDDGRKEERLLFPRYHQLDAVRRLVGDARKHGPGKRYLIQHSAGSGKTYTISWLAHQLNSLHNADDGNGKQNLHS